MHVTAEQITQMYKARWQIEVVFRLIKQHKNLTTLHARLSFVQFSSLFILCKLPNEWMVRMVRLIQKYTPVRVVWVTISGYSTGLKKTNTYANKTKAKK
ncbi:transposase [Paenibacillus sp. GCM10027626]|uniref:transposase n=1 Tax=Paenibacillus sp. GCM10027626 TaxID=3273411 RepID=UPI00362DF368